MPNQLEVYKCTHCGNIVEVIHGGGASLVCCGENMKLMKEGSTDGAMEKHVPVIEKIEGGYKVTVGSVSETYTAPPELCAATLALRAAHFRREAGYYLQIGRWVHA